MSKTIIMTDSTCDLEKDVISKYNIYVMPLYVNFLEEAYKDGVDITTPKLYEMVEEKGILPKTSAVSAFEFEEEFRRLVNEGYNIIYTGISSKMSSTYNNAMLASKEFDGKVFVVDSKNLSTGIGLLVLKAAKYALLGYEPQKIVEEMEKIIPLIRSQFAIATLDYLHKGGRCSSVAALVGGVLKLKPIIEVRDGAMSVGKKPMGKMKRALDIMINDLYKEDGNIDLDCIMITHSMADESAKYIKDELSKKYDPAILMETHAGCVISSHCGEGTIGILYILNK